MKIRFYNKGDLYQSFLDEMNITPKMDDDYCGEFNEGLSKNGYSRDDDGDIYTYEGKLRIVEGE